MGLENCFKGIDDYAVRLIKHKARQLARRSDFSESDRQDIEQELVLDLLRRFPNYRPDRAQRSTFIARIIEHKVATLLEARRREKRGGHVRTRSLSDQVRDDEGKAVELADTVGEQDYFRRTGQHPRQGGGLCDLCMDVQTVLARLSPEHRRLCDLLQTMSVAAASRELRIPRGTVYEDIKKLRAIFEDAGLRRFLSDTSGSDAVGNG